MRFEGTVMLFTDVDTTGRNTSLGKVEMLNLALNMMEFRCFRESPVALISTQVSI